MKKIICFIVFQFTILLAIADNGYRLWLRYDVITDQQLLSSYRKMIKEIWVSGTSEIAIAAKEELEHGLSGLLNQKITFVSSLTKNGTIITGTPQSSPLIASLQLQALKNVGSEGYCITTKTIQGKACMVIAANTHIGVLYGSFHLLKLLQTNQSIKNINIISTPTINCRILNHWDNLNRTVERGYAGFSLWNWQTLPDIIEHRYIDYARANASIGINGVVLNNVNANALILTKEYLVKVAALAKVFRKYGIKVYLTARFSSPIEIGGLLTADPLDAGVKKWWAEKTDEVYGYIPDFGGYLVKANSEGQPGPQNYGRNHADGANMLADVLAPHHGIVMWRAFVYSSDTPEDRFKQAFSDFKPLDGKFKKNVIIQVKNGPIDFQPREPFHPLFGAMPKTNMMAEFQITQEYLGFATHLVYLAPLFKECLDADTYTQGKGTTVASIIDGATSQQNITAIAGVANIGNDVNWCGHPFAQANWYAYGRLAWDNKLSSETIARDWIQMTFTNNTSFVDPVKKMMLDSREAAVNYMTPLGLHHIMGYGHHYGPAPWYDKAPRADWNPVYFHKASIGGIGFNRTATGSNALAQYAPEVSKKWADSATCPDEYLLWFHHVSWNHTMQTGRSLWDELCIKYDAGKERIIKMNKTWSTLKAYVDTERFEQVRMLLQLQQKEATWWRDACVLYFQSFSKMPTPIGFEPPIHDLEYYKQLSFSNVPGN